MNDISVEVRNLSKQYRLGLVGTGTLSHDLNRAWAKLRGKSDPYAKIGDVNDRTIDLGQEYVWALNDVSFDVKKGEVLGIIGKNGAGKSTLLKILSKVTSPTSGYAKMHGRVGSLLEVGTGFHPELTGKENVYLNGAILGMKKWEINKKLEQIVEFAGVSKYLNTPVKRYSSGMKVRLAFAVAAYLEPEILIIDEVLAVGDAEFQKKCINKMQDVTGGSGNTVLFVSHNLTSVSNLCAKSLLIHQGKLHNYGDTKEIISEYMQIDSAEHRNLEIERENDKCKKVCITKVTITQNNEKKNHLSTTELAYIAVEFNKNIEPINKSFVAVIVYDSMGNQICFSSSEDEKEDSLHTLDKGVYSYSVSLPCNFFMPGQYFVTVSAYEKEVGNLDKIEGIKLVYIDELSRRGERGLYRKSALTAPLLHWEL